MKIDKNIPVPARNVSKTGVRDTLKKMAVGDSILFATPGAAAGARGYGSAAFPGWKFAQRKEGAGMRLWRIA